MLEFTERKEFKELGLIPNKKVDKLVWKVIGILTVITIIQLITK